MTLSLWVECLRERSHSIPVLRVQIDVTKVSIKKMDIAGNNEVAGARLLLKDKEGNVIESWMSATEAHVFEQKLIAGETYTLAEVTAPSGYEVAADITFTVNKDGTISIDGKAVDGNEIIMKDDTTPVGEEGKLVVSKLVTFQGKNQAVNRTFYVALFSDADCTQKVSNVKELKCEGAWSAYTVFEHLKDGTYYVAETDEDGNKLESSEVCKIEGNGTKCEITPTQKTAYAVIENQLLIPEYDKYLKDEDDGDDTDGNEGKEKKKTSTSKNNSSNKTTKKGKNSKTGDNSHILFYAALAAAALAAGSAEVYRRRRRATGRNKHDR